MASAKIKIWASYSGIRSSDLLNEVDSELQGSNVELLRFERVVDSNKRRSVDERDDHYSSDADSPHLDCPTVQYYLRPGEAIDSLIVKISYQARLLFCLSEHYFKSPYCLSELACSLCFTPSNGFRIIDHSSSKINLLNVLKGKRKIACGVPGSQIVQMYLNEALAATMRARYGVDEALEDNSPTFLLGAKQFQILLNKLVDKITCEPKACEMSAMVRDLAQERFFIGDEYSAANNFSRWLDNNPLAEKVFSELDWQGCPSLLTGCTAKIYLDRSNSGVDGIQGSVDLLSWLRDFRKQRIADVEIDQWRDFIATLAGFVAIPLVSQQWIDAVAAVPGGTLYVEGVDADSKSFQACIGHAALTGSSAMLNFDRKSQSIKSDSVVDIARPPNFPNRLQTTFSRLFVKALWANLRTIVYDEVPLSDNTHPTGLNRIHRGQLCAWIREKKLQRGEGACALYLDLEEYERTERWEANVTQALVDLRDNEDRSPHDLLIDTLVVPRFNHRADVHVLKSGSEFFDRYNTIEEILKLADYEPNRTNN